jgi:hypothetical protein
MPTLLVALSNRWLQPYSYLVHEQSDYLPWISPRLLHSFLHISELFEVVGVRRVDVLAGTLVDDAQPVKQAPQPS